MSTIQVWADENDREILNRLKAFMEHKVDEEFRDKAYTYSSGKIRKRRRIKRPKINETYIYRQALNWFWLKNERRVIRFEKSQRYR